MDTKRMNIKKNQASTKNKESMGVSNPVHFLGDVKSEFKKITWTEPEELKTYTKVVVGATFVVGLGIYLVDLGLQTALNTLEYLMKAIVG